MYLVYNHRIKNNTFTLQDRMNELFKGQSAADHGTLYQIKNSFQHRNVSLKVMDCFNHAADFWRFCTEGMTILLACKLKKTKKVRETPGDIPINPSREIRQAYLNNLAKDIVETVWCEFGMAEVSKVLDAEVDHTSDQGYQWCYCGEGKKICLIFRLFKKSMSLIL